MSGDLLEDLMSSEGGFVYTRMEKKMTIIVKELEKMNCVCNKEVLEYISALWLMASFYASCTSHIFLCLFHLQCSRLSSVCPLHPATTTTYTTWMRQKACATSLTSPYSTSDPWDCCQSEKQFPIHANLPSFSPSPPPSTGSEGEKRCRKANMIQWAFKDTSALTQGAQAELSQTVARCTASWRNTGENKTFYLLLFQGNIVKTNDK